MATLVTCVTPHMTQQDEKKIGTDSREEPILTRPEFWAHPLVHAPHLIVAPLTPPPAPLSISSKGGRKTCLRPHSFPRSSAGVEANTFYRRSLPTPLKPQASVLQTISSQPPAQPRTAQNDPRRLDRGQTGHARSPGDC